MIKMRKMTGAYLFNNNRILMLKRNKERTLAPNLWTGIGGHIEDNEQTNPEMACLREIYEETGIKSNQIEKLELRYILMRKSKDEIRQHYIYFGKTSISNFINSYEGELHWIDLPDLLNLEMPLTVTHMLKHFLNNQNDRSIFIGSVNNSQVEWNRLVE
jgi:8-oxo-dGTP diphosphatase